MSVKNITPDAVFYAVQAGYDDVYKLAEHFVVLHTSHTLRSTLNVLERAGRLTVSEDIVWGRTRWAVA